MQSASISHAFLERKRLSSYVSFLTCNVFYEVCSSQYILPKDNLSFKKEYGQLKSGNACALANNKMLSYTSYLFCNTLTISQ